MVRQLFCKKCKKKKSEIFFNWILATNDTTTPAMPSSGCCKMILSINKWDNGAIYTMGGTRNGRPYWINSQNGYAFWYDGHRGADFDWFFGYATNVGHDSTSSSKMASDEEAECPPDVADWTNDNSARVTCGTSKFSNFFIFAQIFLNFSCFLNSTSCSNQ